MTDHTTDSDKGRAGKASTERAGGATDSERMADPHAALERSFIEEFLHARGQTLSSVSQLPGDEATALLRSAAAYATLRLTEIETRSHYIAELEP